MGLGTYVYNIYNLSNISISSVDLLNKWLLSSCNAENLSIEWCLKAVYNFWLSTYEISNKIY